MYECNLHGCKPSCGYHVISMIEHVFLLGYLVNNDVPMYIANSFGGKFFVGCLDEVTASL